MYLEVSQLTRAKISWAALSITTNPKLLHSPNIQYATAERLTRRKSNIFSPYTFEFSVLLIK